MATAHSVSPRWWSGLTSHASILCLLVILWVSPILGADKTAADYYISSLPGQPDGPLLHMHAGHIEIVPEHNGNLFFWHYENRHIANRRRTVLWLNGGPGCSSMDGALMEIGPYRLKDDAHLVYNEGSWDEFANLLFVDNPVGTGFSYVDTDSYDHELTTMAEHMITFLTKFFALFPDHATNDIYIAGESYAGQHIPYVAKAILDRNQKSPTEAQWNLSGLLIGNGWISPAEQYHSYLDYAYKAGVIQKGTDTSKQIEEQQSTCDRGLDKPNGTDNVDLPQCEQILQDILRLSQKNNQCYNMYDVRLKDSYPSCGMNWPPDLTSVTPYLRRKEVISALHINKDKHTGWTECSGAVGSNFKAKESKPSIRLLPDLLKEIPIVLFSGDQDLICNHLGTEQLIHNMEWNGGKGMEIAPGTWAPRRDWTFEGEPAGIYQEARNLTYVLFYNSSHMVPFDYSRRSRDMLDRFMNVDIASIGGIPTDSRIDGEKGMEVSVGGHPNSTTAEKAEKEKIERAKWDAYYKSGEVALVVVIVLAGIWAWWVWHDRKRRAGYQGLFGGDNSGGGMGGGFRENRHGRDVEAADFDEAELDDLHVKSPREDGVNEDRYSLGGASSDVEDEKPHGSRKLVVNGHASNGHASNGHASNGHASNGHATGDISEK